MATTQLAVVDENSAVAVAALDLNPRHKFAVMAQIAEEAARAIKAAGFTSRIQGRDYVQVEGWTLIGLAWGCTVRERSVQYVEGLGWEAHVDVVRIDTGVVVGGASHIVGDDEATWRSRDTYAKRSMAVTRATGKALRMMFSATVKMAGYEPTPAEEMPVEFVEKPRPTKKTTRTPKAEPDVTNTVFDKAVGLVETSQSRDSLHMVMDGIKADHAMEEITDEQFAKLRELATVKYRSLNV